MKCDNYWGTDRNEKEWQLIGDGGSTFLKTPAGSNGDRLWGMEGVKKKGQEIEENFHILGIFSFHIIHEYLLHSYKIINWTHQVILLTWHAYSKLRNIYMSKWDNEIYDSLTKNSKNEIRHLLRYVLMRKENMRHLKKIIGSTTI